MLNTLIALEQGLYDQTTLSHAFPSLIEGATARGTINGVNVSVKVGAKARVLYYINGKRVAFETLYQAITL